MRAAHGFWRRIYWTDHASGDQLTIGVVVCAPGGGYAWGQRPDLSLVARASGMTVAGLSVAFHEIARFLADADDLTRYAACVGDMAEVRLGEPLYAACHDQDSCLSHRDQLMWMFARRDDR